MSYPDRVEGTRLCIAVAADGVRVYGNREAFRSLAAWMSWMAQSDPSEHYECHTRFNLGSEATLFEQGPPNVWALLDERIAASFTTHPQGQEKLELTFMAVEEHDLDALLAYESSGVVPKEWFDADE